jgi:CHAT domain-containing protein/Tfp pilus assembly protein PilF
MRASLQQFAWTIALGLLAASSALGQFDSSQRSATEHYNLILRLMAQQDNVQAVEESKKLIVRTPLFEHTYIKLAIAATMAQRLDEAQAFLETQLANTPPNPLAYFGLGLLYQQRKDLTSAIEYYQRSLTVLPEHERTFILLVNAWRDLKQPQASEAFIKSMLAAQPQNASAHFGLGYHYFQHQQYEAALAELESAIVLDAMLSDAHFIKASVLSSRGRYPEALSAIRRGLQVVEAKQDEERQRTLLALKSRTETQLGLYGEALSTLNHTLALARKCGDQYIEENSLSQIASVYYRQDNYVQAEHYWQQALVVARELKVGGFASYHLGNLGELRYRLGDIPGALEFYQQALNSAVLPRDLRNRVDVLMSVGGIRAVQGNFKEATAVFEETLLLAQQLKSLPLQTTGFNALTELYARSGDFPKALIIVQQAVKLAQELSTPTLLGRSLNNLGAIKLRLGAIPAALQAYQEALAIGESRSSPLTVWQAHAGLAASYVKLGQPNQAREHYRKAIEEMERVRAQLGGEEEKAGFFQDKNEAYKQLIALLLTPPPSTAANRDLPTQRRDEAEAFHYAERARARAFLDLLAEAKVNLDQNLAPDLLEQQQALQKQITQLTAQLLKEGAQEPAKQDQAKIAALGKGLSQADGERRDWQNEVRRRNPHYAALKYPEPISLEQTQRLLGEQTLLLSYSLGETESFLFAVSRSDLLVVRLPAAASIGQRVEQLLAAITDKNRPAADEYRRQAAELSKQLIQPAGRLLAGKSELIIVPDGALHRLPFEVLFTPAATAQGDLRRLPYLINKFAVSYAPSASVLAGLWNETRTAAPKSFVAFADPAYEQNAESVIASTVRAASAGGRLNLNRLPHSRREAEGIAKLFGCDTADLFLGAAASEENAKLKDRLSQYRLVHFSTHGYVNEARPRFSGLVLSLPPADKAGQSEDGLLSAYEIFNLKLNAELVVLSACETGLGKEVKGEGLMSLMRAFMFAGTPSVMVSLWKVDDESAADLMIRFYRYWHQGVKEGNKTVKVNKAEALRRAQLDAIAQGDFPYYWAPFVLMGRP